MILMENGEWIIDNDFVTYFLMLINKVSDLFSKPYIVRLDYIFSLC